MIQRSLKFDFHTGNSDTSLSAILFMYKHSAQAPSMVWSSKYGDVHTQIWSAICKKNHFFFGLMNRLISIPLHLIFPWLTVYFHGFFLYYRGLFQFCVAYQAWRIFLIIKEILHGFTMATSIEQNFPWLHSGTVDQRLEYLLCIMYDVHAWSTYQNYRER